MLFTTSDDARIHVRDTGSGPTVVLLHGWAASAEYWGEQIPRLASGHRVIAPDFRAHGASSPVRYGHRIARYAKDIHELILALAPGQPIRLVGWSMGAAVAWSLMDLFPDLPVEGMVVYDQTPRLLNDAAWKHGAPGLTREFLEAQDQALRRDYPGFLHQFLPAMFVDPDAHDVANRFLPIALRLDPDAAADILLDHCNQDWRDVVRRLKAPMLAIAGADFGAADGVQALRGLNRNVEVVVVPNARHCLFIEQPDDFHHLLCRFFDSAPTAPTEGKPPA